MSFSEGDVVLQQRLSDGGRDAQFCEDNKGQRAVARLSKAADSDAPFSLSLMTLSASSSSKSNSSRLRSLTHSSETGAERGISLSIFPRSIPRTSFEGLPCSAVLSSSRPWMVGRNVR